ncbi:Hsp90 cochaperone [Savitreella phatthalungensis]
MSAADLKAKGNAAFSAKDFPTAIDFFSQAIQVDPQNHVLYSNRSACHASLKDYSQALTDAEKCISIKPDWAKGYTRQGAALHGLNDLPRACDAYEKALELEPSNVQAQQGMNSIEQQMKREMGSGNFAPGGASDPFAEFAKKLSDPAFYQKMSENPQTSKLLGDAEFMAKLDGIKKNPSSIMQQISDPRMVSILGLLLGQDVGAPPADDARDTPMRDAEPSEQAKERPAPTAAQQSAPEPELDDNARATQQAKTDADAAKAEGNALYKQRKFPEAIACYEKAYELHKDITYMTNKAAAQFEAGDYADAIKTCEDAIEQGREMRADYKIIAKAFARIGTCYEKQGELAKAVLNYNKSLTEHRTPEVLKKLKAAEKTLEEKEKRDYESPEKAEEARVAGNDAFKRGDFPAAVKEYTEMTKRAPEDARAYANRAAAYIKLMSMPEAIKDCDTATKFDPTFVKAYIRKATALLAMKEYSRASTELDHAAEHDADKKHTQEIAQLQYKVQSQLVEERSTETEAQTQQRIQNDPEVMAILQDPVMQTILEQARQNPAALNEHMQKSPQVAQKIQKLVQAGVIRTR